MNDVLQYIDAECDICTMLFAWASMGDSVSFNIEFMD